MKFKAEFTIDNDAFKGNQYEMIAIIQRIANDIAGLSYEDQAAGLEPTALMDSNGNRIGFWEIVG